MENSQNKLAAFAFISILVILVLVAFLFKPEQPVEAPVVDEKPLPSQVDPALNFKIIDALSSFADIAPDINDVEAVCAGGFINDRVAPLKKIADDIVSSRVIDPQTMQYAATQDEAGIACESLRPHGSCLPRLITRARTIMASITAWIRSEPRGSTISTRKPSGAKFGPTNRQH